MNKGIVLSQTPGSSARVRLGFFCSFELKSICVEDCNPRVDLSPSLMLYVCDLADVKVCTDGKHCN